HVDGEQGEPSPADAERDALKEPSIIRQPRDLGKGGARNDKQDHKGNASERRVAHPPTPTLSGKEPREHKTGDGQPQEDKSREEAVEATRYAVLQGEVRRSGWVAVHGISDKDSCAE